MHLKEYVRITGMAHKKIAAMCGIKRSHATNIINGMRLPSSRIARRVIAATDGKVTWGDIYGDPLSPAAPTDAMTVRETEEVAAAAAAAPAA